MISRCIFSTEYSRTLLPSKIKRGLLSSFDKFKMIGNVFHLMAFGHLEAKISV